MDENLNFPYLSIVICSRNDDHGQNMFKRMYLTLNSLITQLEKYKLESEILLVDYNPPEGKPLLKDALALPKGAKYCSVRTVIVPLSIHSKCQDSDKLAFNGPLAFNVGLRRCKGKFVLLVPVDNLFSGELIEFLARKNLKNDKFYRADRLDVSGRVMEIDSPEERIRFCKNNILWIHTRYGSFPVVRKKKHLRSASLDFARIGNRAPLLHTNAPDIMLTSRESWFLLRGYPEIVTFGLHLDSLLCYIAYYNGLKEEILPPECCLFHIAHESRWKDIHPLNLEKMLFYCFSDSLALKLRWLVNGVANRFIPGNLLQTPEKNSRIKVKKLGVNLFDIRPVLSQMKRTRRPVVFNDSNWGLGDELLDEYVIRLGEWES